MRIEYFQLIDRIIALDLAEHTILTEAIVPTTSTIFEGHFPGHPLMPGVLLIECMAQTCGWMTSAINGFSGLPALASVKEAKLREPVFPGYRLEFDGQIIHDGSGFAMAECQGRREGKVVCSAGLTYRIIPYPSGTFRQTMLDMARMLEFPLEEFLRD